MAGQDAGEQTGRSAGIAELQHVGRFTPAAHAEAAHPPAAGRAVVGHLGAKGPQRAGGCQHVLAFEQALNRRLAQRQRAEHQGAMRDRLVAWTADATAQAVDRMSDEFGRIGSGRQGDLRKRRTLCDAALSYHAGIWF